jgi:diaminopimelate epimerase
MTSIPFCKFHGFGNDYIVVEREKIASTADLSAYARAICHRHTGAGADGVALVGETNDPGADLFCEIINPDGSIAGFSGNGTRCAAAYLYHKELWSEPELRLETRSGINTFRLIEKTGPTSYSFEAGIGKPRFSNEEVPVRTDGPRDAVVNEPISVDGRDHRFSAINVGNPVACIFVDELNFDWRPIGRRMEMHESFPQRTNVVFVKVSDRQNIEVRIWERGAGETSASGTCSAGAAVLSAFLLKTERDVAVHSAGGTTHVLWRKDDEIVLTGQADLAYCGEWPVQNS